MFPAIARRTVHLVQCFNQFQPGLRAFSRNLISDIDATNDGTKKPRPKTVPVPKITLISLDNSISITILENAERLAKRRNLILNKITDFDAKTQRPIYKLMCNSEYEKFGNTESGENDQEQGKSKQKYDQEQGKSKQKLKDAKLFYISAKIAEHDLKTKMKKTIKLLKKGHKIKFIITLDDNHEVSCFVGPMLLSCNIAEQID